MELDRLFYSCVAFFFDQGRVDKAWDAKLNRLLDLVEEGEIMFTSPHSEIHHNGNKDGIYTINLNSDEIWVTNFPYCFGNSWTGKEPRSALPSVRTRWRLKRALLHTPIFVTKDNSTNSDELVMLRFKSGSFYA